MSTTDIGPSEALATLFTPAGKHHPYPLYEALRTLGQIVQLGPRTTLVLGYEECAAALRESRLHVTDAGMHRQTGMIDHSSWQCFTKIMMFSNGDEHQRFRQFAQGTYTRRHVEQLRPLAEQACARLLDRLGGIAARGGALDLVSEFSFRLPMTVTGEMLDIPEEDRMGLRAAITACTTAFEPISDLAELASGDAGMDRLTGYLDNLIDRRRAEPGDDLISTMVRTRDNGNLVSEEELRAHLVLLLIAGTQTPSDLIGNALRIALDDPGLARAVVASPEMASAFLTETMRWDPAIHALTRVAAEDLDLCGTPIAAGSRLLLVIAAANRDARRFAAPERFDLQRGNNQPLAFGLGQHYCLGAAFARMQVELAVPMFLRRFPLAAAAAPPSYRDQLVQRGFAYFPVTLM